MKRAAGIISLLMVAVLIFAAPGALPAGIDSVRRNAVLHDVDSLRFGTARHSLDSLRTAHGARHTMRPHRREPRGDSLRTGFFRYNPATQSLLADLHPHFLRFDIASGSNHSEYDYGQTGLHYRVGFYGNVAANIPIYFAEIEPRRKPAPQPRTYAIAITMPIQAQIWLDLLEPRTAPIVDTDYRISLPVWTFIHRTRKNFLKNYTISLAPFIHESTHLGDELALQHHAHNLPLRRVNVSANWWEVQFTINAEEQRLTQNHCLRAGLIMLWNPHSGWYFIDDREGDPTLGGNNESPWEAYLQYQYQSTARKGFQGVAAIEVRNRALLNYPSYALQDDGTLKAARPNKTRVFTYNLFLGFRYNNLRYNGIFSRFSTGVRLYHGSNPYGQFRNHTNFNQFGLCLIIE